MFGLDTNQRVRYNTSDSVSTRSGLRPDELARIRAVLSRHGDVKEAILYGSRAKGTFRPGSDIDLALAGETLSLQEANRIAAELDDLNMPYEIDLTLREDIENPDLCDHIERVGIQVFKR